MNKKVLYKFRIRCPNMTASYTKDWVYSTVMYLVVWIKKELRVNQVNNLNNNPVYGYDDERKCDYAEFRWLVSEETDAPNNPMFFDNRLRKWRRKPLEKVVWFEAD